ncbi:hypothetical protein Tco_1265362 [Tanacetum coccineum]
MTTKVQRTTGVPDASASIHHPALTSNDDRSLTQSDAYAESEPEPTHRRSGVPVIHIHTLEPQVKELYPSQGFLMRKANSLVGKQNCRAVQFPKWQVTAPVQIIQTCAFCENSLIHQFRTRANLSFSTPNSSTSKQNYESDDPCPIQWLLILAFRPVLPELMSDITVQSSAHKRQNGCSNVLFEASLPQDKRFQIMTTLPRAPKTNVVFLHREDRFRHNKGWNFSFSPLLEEYTIQHTQARKQEEGIDLEEFIAPVARMEAVRFLLPTQHTKSFSNLSDGRENVISQMVHEGRGLRCSSRKHFRRIQFLGDKLVSWRSKKQNCTAMSSAETEYVTLSASCAQVMWMRTRLKVYGFNYNKILLYYDSQSAIAISCKAVQHSHTKHIHTRYKDGKVRSKCENKGIVPTEMELVLEYTQQGASHEVSYHLKMEMEMEIPSSSNVKLITECSDTTYTCYEVIKDLIKVSKLPQTLLSYSSSQVYKMAIDY